MAPALLSQERESAIIIINIMKEDQSKTFTQWMDHLSAEQDAINKAEAKTAARRALIAKLSGALFSLGGVALVAGGFVYRAEIGQWLHDKTGFGPGATASSDGSSSTAGGDNKTFKQDARENFGNNLKAAQDFAKERDRLLAEIQASEEAKSGSK